MLVVACPGRGPGCGGEPLEPRQPGGCWCSPRGVGMGVGLGRSASPLVSLLWCSPGGLGGRSFHGRQPGAGAQRTVTRSSLEAARPMPVQARVSRGRHGRLYLASACRRSAPVGRLTAAPGAADFHHSTTHQPQGLASPPRHPTPPRPPGWCTVCARPPAHRPPVTAPAVRPARTDHLAQPGQHPAGHGSSLTGQGLPHRSPRSSPAPPCCRARGSRPLPSRSRPGRPSPQQMGGGCGGWGSGIYFWWVPDRRGVDPLTWVRVLAAGTGEGRSGRLRA